MTEDDNDGEADFGPLELRLAELAQSAAVKAALFYSVIESAKLCGVEPKAYLLCATRAALENPGTVTLPHALLTS